MSKKISVLLATYRKGGLDISFSGLTHQTMPKEDWELILVDVWWMERSTTVRNYLGNKIDYTHCYPARTLWPVDSVNMHRNSAIALAEGELCIFFCDYMYVRPDYLERMWGQYQQSKPATPIAPHRYWDYPPVNRNWEREIAGISIFEKWWEPSDLKSLWNRGQDADPKLQLQAGGITGMYFHAKNESARLDALLATNGNDEAFDGGHNNSDIEIGCRLERNGNRLVLDPTNIGEIVQVREFYPIARRTKTLEEDLNYYNAISSQVRANNTYNLAEFREEQLKWKHAQRQH